MFKSLIPLSALLLSAAFMLVGHGLLLTLLPIVASSAGFSDTQVALTGSAYFIGFVSGCLLTPFILRRVGHIRTFAVLATLYSVVVLLFPWFTDFTGWLLLRLLTGLSISGLYMAIESWLNERSSSENRGSVLSIYTVQNLVMVMLGQQLLNMGNIGSHALFGLAAIFFSLSIIPVSLTLSLAPNAPQSVKLNLAKVWRHSHVAMMGAVAAGLSTGAFWSLGPLVGKQLGLSGNSLTLYLSAAILGGAVFQFPLGRISDHCDRRIVLFYLGLAAAVFSTVFFVGIKLAPPFLTAFCIALSFLWGAANMTSYAICLAHANDNADSADFVEIGSGMLITLGVCSAVGGPLASLLMRYTGAEGLYLFCALSAAIFTIMVKLRRQSHVIPDTTEHDASFIAASEMATPMAFELDPRAEDSGNAAP